MDSTVRRVDGAITRSTAETTAIQSADQPLPPVARRKDGLSVVSQRSLGISPSVLLTWSVDYQYWNKGYRVLGFRSSTGFAPEEYPKDLGAHGHMILDEIADGSVEERLPEGTYFYTFVLHKRGLLGMFESMSVVRFSETIPSAKTAIGRIEDQLRLQKLKDDHELGLIRNQVARNDAIIALHNSNRKLAAIAETKADDDSVDTQVRREVESVVRKKLKKAMTRVELVVALQDVQKRLRGNPAWKKLDKGQRDRLLEEIMRDLDAEEEFLQP